MTELITGALTAAWLSGDPFSWPQALGGALILAAGLGDVLTSPRRRRSRCRSCRNLKEPSSRRVVVFGGTRQAPGPAWVG
jgi:hypothetical protein